jgi:hypothetical protein
MPRPPATSLGACGTRSRKSLIRDTAKSFARSLGYDIRKIGWHFDKRPIDFIRSRNVDLVVDVGGNTGQYAESLRNDGYAGWIVSFEPCSRQL